MLKKLSVVAALGVTALAGCATAGGRGDCHCKGPADPIVLESQFLAKNARSKGVMVLPGLQYMVLQTGPADGPHPKRTDDVTVRYEGRFLGGQVFGASPRGGLDTETFEVNKLIPGWVAALQMMRPGDIWTIYVPYNLAYGERGKDPIPPYSTLVFRVELVSVAPHVDAPPPPPPAPPPVATPVPLPPPPPPPPPAKKVVHHHKKPKPAAEPKTDGGDASGEASDTILGKMFKGSERE